MVVLGRGGARCRRGGGSCSRVRWGGGARGRRRRGVRGAGQALGATGRGPACSADDVQPARGDWLRRRASSCRPRPDLEGRLGGGAWAWGERCGWGWGSWICLGRRGARPAPGAVGTLGCWDARALCAPAVAAITDDGRCSAAAGQRGVGAGTDDLARRQQLNVRALARPAQASQRRRAQQLYGRASFSQHLQQPSRRGCGEARRRGGCVGGCLRKSIAPGARSPK